MWLIQDIYDNSPEGRAIRQSSLLSDESVIIAKTPYAEMPSNMIPIGSVEFVKMYIEQRSWMQVSLEDYPAVLSAWFNRKISIRPSLEKDAPIGYFVKPCVVKEFDPYIKKEGNNSTRLCYYSEVVEFSSEYRVYVMDGERIGWSQYGEDEDRELTDSDLAEVDNMIKRFFAKTYALDVGFIKNKLSLVEINDAWATGYYKDAMTPSLYAKWLKSGWGEIVRFNCGTTTLKSLENF